MYLGRAARATAVALLVALTAPAIAREAKEVPPELDEAMRNALALLSQENYAEAETAFEAVVEKYPDTATAWGSLGVSRQFQGKYEQAVQAYEKALEFEATRPIALYNLACVYSLMNDLDRSFEWLDKVLDAGMKGTRRLSEDPDLENARQDPRFDEILVRAGAHPRPCEKGERYKALDFWAGRWDVFGSDGAKAGTSAVTKLLRDCALLESWQSANDGARGMSLTLLDPGTGQWRQSWVDDRGSVARYEGSLQEGTLVFEGTSVDADGAVELARMALTPRADGTLRQRIEHSRDGGATWYLRFDGNYVPQADAPAAGAP